MVGLREVLRLAKARTTCRLHQGRVESLFLPMIRQGATACVPVKKRKGRSRAYGRGFDRGGVRMRTLWDLNAFPCGACVDACPTATLMEKKVTLNGRGEHSIVTTYCAVGCSTKGGNEGGRGGVHGCRTRMVMPTMAISCVKGRFAWGYATHSDRILSPMIRKRRSPTRGSRCRGKKLCLMRRVNSGVFQNTHGNDSIGGITSSRCTNEETYLVQKLVRAAFGNNNVDNCARVCHSPTGFGLKQTLGESAGTQTFDSVLKSDVVMVIGANPAAAHPCLLRA